MPRGDIQIDLETNDIAIKSYGNSYSNNETYEDVSNNAIVLSIEVPRNFVDNSVDSEFWKTYLAAIKSPINIDPSHDSKALYVEFYYINNDGLKGRLLSAQSVSLEIDSTKYLTVSDYNSLVDSLENNDDLIFNYYTDENTLHEVFLIGRSVLGDFVIKDGITQNEYTLMDCGEGSFLQNPTFCVGIKQYIQSNSTPDEIIGRITDKFAQDSLRVIGATVVNGTISVQSEEIG